MTRKGFGNSMSKLETGMFIYGIDIHKQDTGICEPYYEDPNINWDDCGSPQAYDLISQKCIREPANQSSA